MLSYMFKSKIGPLYLQEENGKLIRLGFAPLPAAPEQEQSGGSLQAKAPSKLMQEVQQQLEAYFAGKLKKFALPLNPAGTPFMQLVWQALTRIPYGSTTNYKAVAESIGKPGASRAVGMANNKNPIAIIIPCHRVIGANGKLVGYAGGMDRKKALLALENSLLI